MRLEKLALRNFRNVEDTSFQPDPKLNFLVGQNGQGKTSFLEALSYLSTLRSFRSARSDEVIRWGSESGEVSCTAVDSTGDWKSEFRVAFSITGTNPKSGRPRATKSAFINQKPYQSSTQYLCQRFGSVELGFHTIVFNPADHDLVRGEPAIRRAYLDRVLAAEDIDYLKALQKYQRLLEQRNALLRDEVAPSRAVLAGFTEPMGRLAALIAWKRLDWMSRLLKPLNNTVQQIAPKQGKLSAFYSSNWVPKIAGLSIYNNDLISSHFAGLPEVPSLEKLEQAFWVQLSALEQAELRSRSSLVGPHRDDWAFFLDGHVLKGHGSQGEVRSALLALKLSEIELFREKTGHRPLLLLDDFSSELDLERRSFLLRFLMATDLQVFVSTTEETLSIGKRFLVSNGTLNDDATERSESGRLFSR